MILGLTTALVMSLNVNAFDKVIYGDDNRLDVYETTNTLHLELARSTAAMISKNNLSTVNDDVVISNSTLEQRGICETAKFAKQVTAANCSGFLIAEDILVTAGHCVKSQSSCDNYKWVFDFNINSNKTDEVTVSSNSVYSCVEIIDQNLDRSTSDDYAVIRLDRKVTDRDPLTFRKSGKVETGSPLVVIGHPSGLPTKIAADSYVRGNSSSVFFVANLDTFGGNSGSAVFNSETGVVEGILVRGERDYVYVRENGKSCKVPKQCSMTECRGEDVTRITNIPNLADMASDK
jgi:V8-like Glu-specific endopeptidase